MWADRCLITPAGEQRSVMRVYLCICFVFNCPCWLETFRLFATMESYCLFYFGFSRRHAACEVVSVQAENMRSVAVMSDFEDEVRHGHFMFFFVCALCLSNRDMLCETRCLCPMYLTE